MLSLIPRQMNKFSQKIYGFYLIQFLKYFIIWQLLCFVNEYIRGTVECSVQSPHMVWLFAVGYSFKEVHGVVLQVTLYF